jgi:hypothetical protein
MTRAACSAKSTCTYRVPGTASTAASTEARQVSQGNPTCRNVSSSSPGAGTGSWARLAPGQIHFTCSHQLMPGSSLSMPSRSARSAPPPLTALRSRISESRSRGSTRLPSSRRLLGAATWHSRAYPSWIGQYSPCCGARQVPTPQPVSLGHLFRGTANARHPRVVRCQRLFPARTNSSATACCHSPALPSGADGRSSRELPCT